MTSFLVALAGPTASGKTALALELSKRLPIEIVNADSLQVYKHLDIGSAKPTKAEQAAAKHHMIDVLNPDEPADIAWFSERTDRCLEEIRRRGRIPLIVGGSGFYLQSIERPPQEEANVDEASEAHAPLGDEEAYALVVEKDPQLAAKIHPHDRYRIHRAARLILMGKSPSALWSAAKLRPPRHVLRLVIPNLPKEVLKDRIHRRAADMVAGGLIEETRNVLERFPGSRSLLAKAIGYRESLLFLGGEVSKEDMLTQIQQRTRQYAKRQLTWFRGRQNTTFADPKDVLDVLEKALIENKP